MNTKNTTQQNFNLEYKIILYASGAETRFYARVESIVMLSITIQRNIMQKLNCACAYSLTAEQSLPLLLLRTTLAPY